MSCAEELINADPVSTLGGKILGFFLFLSTCVAPKGFDLLRNTDKLVLARSTGGPYEKS